MYAKSTPVIVLPGVSLSTSEAEVCWAVEPDRRYVGLTPSIWQPTRTAWSAFASVKEEVVLPPGGGGLGEGGPELDGGDGTFRKVDTQPAPFF